MDQLQRRAHLLRRRRIARPETRVRQQGRLGDYAEAADHLSSKRGHLRELLGRRIEVDVSVADENRALG